LANVLDAHMANVEATLIAQSAIQRVAGHSLHKGTPREIFIREFLESHLPASLAIGTGEIIDAQSIAGAPRNQFDIVVYRRNFPKVHLGGGIDAFLIESVIATIEVKSSLDEAELRKAIKASQACKALVPNIVRSFTSGWIPPKVLNYVVAYDGPAKMRTIANWLPGIIGGLGIQNSPLPEDEASRTATPSPTIDGIFVLKKGAVYFDNVPIGLANADMRKANPNANWVVADASAGALLLLFLFVQTATANLDGGFLNALPYVSSAKFDSAELI
jgi:hypothetical protein